ncbi:hypothetical protein KO481_27250 [Nocardia sp. NEAU-G5]|uniref:Uncharacterized protein n=1 Tax=Nocardia albiluteola TaxID=2842303 RepID=A0ABS6B4J4_9NOCA|nr:hypothetical protein [Nocardia albiluteola]MBU3065211.1 hypothetical protein [Nocardia albiluteola]
MPAYGAGVGADTIAQGFGGLVGGESSLSTRAADYREIGNAALDFGNGSGTRGVRHGHTAGRRRLLLVGGQAHGPLDAA